MPAALNDDALTDVDAVRRWLGDPDDWGDDDEAAVADAINGVSRSLLLWMGRQFVDEIAVTKRFTYDGGGYIDLTNTELKVEQTALAITAYSDFPTSEHVTLAAATATTEADYRFEPRNGTLEGTYLWIVLPRLAPKTLSGTTYEPLGSDKLVEISITGDWGAGQVPPDVKLACTEECAFLYRNPEGAEDRSVGPYSMSDSDDNTFGLSRRARERTRGHRRVNLA